jgi:hypothetical protein
MTNTYGGSSGTGDFKITVNGEPGAISSSGRCREVVWERSGPIVDYRLDVAYDGYPYDKIWSLQSLTTCAVGFNEVTEFGYRFRSWRRVPQLVTLDSVRDGMYCGYGDGFCRTVPVRNCGRF